VRVIAWHEGAYSQAARGPALPIPLWMAPQKRCSRPVKGNNEVSRRSLTAVATGVWLIILGIPRDGLAAGAKWLDGTDPRLLLPVQLQARQLAVPEVLRSITDQTGVLLKAEGEAADLRITAFVSRTPLSAFMTRLGTLLHLTWRRTGQNEQSSYALYPPGGDGQAVLAAKAAEWERFRVNVHRLMRAASRPDALGDSPLDRAALDFVSAGQSGRAAWQFLAVLPDPLIDAALHGEIVRVPFKSLSPPQQEALRRFLGAMRALRNSSESEIQEGDVQLKVDRHRGDGQHAQLALEVHQPSGMDEIVILSMVPDGAIPYHFDSRQYVASLPPSLDLPDSRTAWEEALARFARENRVSVLSDAFDVAEEVPPGTIQPPPAGISPAEALDQFCFYYDYTWNAAEPLLLFRRRDWFLERARQIPARLASHWQQVIRQGGIYSMADLAQMALLNEVQWEKLWKYAGHQARQTASENRELLLLYGALRPEQRALAHQRGLPIDHLALDQQKLLPPILARVRPGPPDLARSFVRLEVREKPGQSTTTICILFRDGERRTVSVDRRAEPTAGARRVGGSP
jgi:hypothetical protein